MSTLLSKKAVCLGLHLAGIGLMCVAMFMHPMSPEDFLALVLSDPLQTVADTQGGAAAFLFWCGALPAVVGAAALASRLFTSVRHLHLDYRHRPAH